MVINGERRSYTNTENTSSNLFPFGIGCGCSCRVSVGGKICCVEETGSFSVAEIVDIECL